MTNPCPHSVYDESCLSCRNRRYLMELSEYIQRDEAGTLSKEEKLRGLCKFSWLNLDGFGDPDYSGHVVYVEDVLSILDEGRLT